ncbi:MAG: hypothetical protein DRG83_00250 [Deltaproteobacteria bacterium]|nr:MAG: hypothetical protein DRG83_00250 [Deltaproteobacteria bacterium]
MKKILIVLLIIGFLMGCTNNRELTNEFLRGFLMGLGSSTPTTAPSPFIEIQCDTFSNICYIYKNGRLIGTCTPQCWGGQCYCW